MNFPTDPFEFNRYLKNDYNWHYPKCNDYRDYAKGYETTKLLREFLDKPETPNQLRRIFNKWFLLAYGEPEGTMDIIPYPDAFTNSKTDEGKRNGKGK